MISHGYPPTISGVTLVVQKLARAMVRKGHFVTVLTGSDRREPYDADDHGVRLIRVRSLANPFWKEGPIPYLPQKDLEAILDEAQPDLVHVHEGAILGIQIVRVGCPRGLPLLATSYYVPRFVARYLSLTDQPQSLVESIAWAYATWFFNQFDHVVFATRAHRHYFLQKGLHVPTTLISNGVDTTRYCPANDGQAPGASNGRVEDVEAGLHLPPRPRILFVSRLMQDKEIDVLIRAMPHVTARHPAHLLLAGRGDDRRRLEDLTDELGLRDCVHFLGFVPEADMPALYRASDLFAMAATTEVQSIPTLQATATALPVVAADAVALPELVHHGENGFLFPPGDSQAAAEAIVRILDDPEMAARMGRAGLAITAPHAETSTFDQYEALYCRMREGCTQPPPDVE